MPHEDSSSRKDQGVTVTTTELQLLEPREVKVPSVAMEFESGGWLPECDSKSSLRLAGSYLHEAGESGAA